MPDHKSWLTFLLEGFGENFAKNAQAIGDTFFGVEPTVRSFEPIAASLFVCALILLAARRVRFQLEDVDNAVIPSATLNLRTFMETFLGYFHDMAKGVMDAERAKKYFPLIGASALFVFVSNIMAMLPTFPVATSSLNITAGCALVVFLLFNIYGLMSNGFAYIAHMAGPAWYLWWLIFPIEVLSLCVRPITLAVRLMLNMSVDHLILGIMLSLFPMLLPLPTMVLGIVIILVQTLVFALLTCIYIGLATEHEAH